MQVNDVRRAILFKIQNYLIYLYIQTSNNEIKMWVVKADCLRVSVLGAVWALRMHVSALLVRCGCEKMCAFAISMRRELTSAIEKNKHRE